MKSETTRKRKTKKPYRANQLEKNEIERIGKLTPPISANEELEAFSDSKNICDCHFTKDVKLSEAVDKMIERHYFTLGLINIMLSLSSENAVIKHFLEHAGTVEGSSDPLECNITVSDYHDSKKIFLEENFKIHFRATEIYLKMQLLFDIINKNPFLRIAFFRRTVMNRKKIFVTNKIY